MAIFQFFKMAAAAILDYCNFKFLTVGTLKSAKLHQRAKFRRNRSNRGRDMVIFRFFKMASAAMLDFSNCKFLTVGRLKRADLRRRAKFCRNRSNRGQDMAILPSNRHRPSSGDCLEGKGENYQVCSVQYCVQQLCTVRCTHI